MAKKEIIPKGGTILSASDVIVTINDERDFSYVHEKMEALCAESNTGVKIASVHRVVYRC